MSEPAAVNLTVCVALIRSELSGYREYPRTPTGEERFGRALQDIAVSVEHAEAILSKFTEEFPTVQQIVDVGLNLRPQFEPKKSQREEWEKQFGKPEAFAVGTGHGPGQCLCCNREWSEISRTHRTDDTRMWRRIKAHLNVRDFAHVSWGAVYQAKKDLGYSLTAFEEETRRTSGAKPRPVAIIDVPQAITAEDIARAEEASRRAKAVPAVDSDGWSDPDR